MGRRSPAPDGWITVHRVATHYGLRDNRRLVLGLCRRAGIEVRRFGPGKTPCLRIRDVSDLLAWVDIWEHRLRLD